MVQTRESFKQLLELGVEGEHLIGRVLIDQGVTLLPLYQFENSDKAPLIFSADLKTAAPDLTCFSKGRVWFVEVKTKRRWVDFNGNKETGLDKKSFDRYSIVKKLTELDVYLFFNHTEKEPLGVFYAELDEYTRYWDGKYRGSFRYEPMYFYDYDILRTVGGDLIDRL